MSNSPKNQAEEMAENITAQVRAVASAMNGGYMRGVNITIFRPCFSCSEPDFSFDAERLYYDQNWGAARSVLEAVHLQARRRSVSD